MNDNRLGRRFQFKRLERNLIGSNPDSVLQVISLVSPTTISFLLNKTVSKRSHQQEMRNKN